MTSFLSVFSIALYTSLSTAQTVICVWNSLNYYDWYNGEYNKVPNVTFHGYPYFVKDTPATCGTIYLHNYYDDTEDYERDYWQIATSLTEYYVTYSPYCDASPHPSNPTSCVSNGGNWYQFEETQGKEKLYDMTVTDGPCPTLNCDTIQLSNTGLAQCDQIFTRNTNYNNVWQYGTYPYTYLYFNQNTFRWYCSATLGIPIFCCCSATNFRSAHTHQNSKYVTMITFRYHSSLTGNKWKT
eukprot:495499_1